MSLYHISLINWVIPDHKKTSDLILPIALAIWCDNNDSASIYKKLEEKYGFKVACANIQPI